MTYHDYYMAYSRAIDQYWEAVALHDILLARYWAAHADIVYRVLFLWDKRPLTEEL